MEIEDEKLGFYFYGLIGVTEDIFEGHRGINLHIPMGISSPTMVVDKAAAFIFYKGGRGKLYTQIQVLNKESGKIETIGHEIDLIAGYKDNFVIALDVGTTFGFRSDDKEFLEVLVLDP